MGFSYFDSMQALLQANTGGWWLMEQSGRTIVVRPRPLSKSGYGSCPTDDGKEGLNTEPLRGAKILPLHPTPKRLLHAQRNFRRRTPFRAGRGRLM